MSAIFDQLLFKSELDNAVEKTENGKQRDSFTCSSREKSGTDLAVNQRSASESATTT